MTLKQLKQTLLDENVGFDFVKVSRKDKCFVTGESYFYRHGKTPEMIAAKLKTVFPNAVIIDTGDQMHSFNGGAEPGSAKDSFMWVKFTVPETNTIQEAMTNREKNIAKRQFILECAKIGKRPTKSAFSKMINESFGNEKYVTLTFRQDARIPTYTDARTHTPINDSFRAGERIVDAKVIGENATTINIEFADGAVAYDLPKALFVEMNVVASRKDELKEVAKREFITECNKRGITPTKSEFSKMLNEINII